MSGCGPQQASDEFLYQSHIHGFHSLLISKFPALSSKGK